MVPHVRLGEVDPVGRARSAQVPDEDRVSALLDRHADVVVSGTVENQGRFYDLFEHVVLLSAPVEVLIEPVATRTNNP